MVFIIFGNNITVSTIIVKLACRLKKKTDLEFDHSKEGHWFDWNKITQDIPEIPSQCDNPDISLITMGLGGTYLTFGLILTSC